MTKLSLIDVSKPLLVLIAGPYLSGTNCQYPVAHCLLREATP